MEKFRKVISILNLMKEEKILLDYAIFGGYAVTFYSEPILTYDLDILFDVVTNSNLLILSDIYDWLKRKGYKTSNEQVMIEGLPVQFLTVYNELTKEALDNAVFVESIGTKIVSLEHLMAIALHTFRPKDKERFIKLLSENKFDSKKLQDILIRHKLNDRYQKIKGFWNE